MLEFNEEQHEYKLNGEILVSVTQFLDKYFRKFDEDKWSKKFALKDNVSQDTILKEWERRRKRACEYGTYIHEQIENLINEERYNSSLKEIEQTKHLLKLFKGDITSEFRIYSEELGIAGTIDCVVEKDDNVYILDWKTGEKPITKESKYSIKALKPIEHLDDCNYIRYSLQLGLYKYILEKEYNKKVKGMGIVKLDRRKFKYDLIEPANLEKEIVSLLNESKLI
tara:strand:- start:657 stop:1331 length:675 start_codon:yes stop_codon:yes gene_type:complete